MTKYPGYNEACKAYEAAQMAECQLVEEACELYEDALKEIKRLNETIKKLEREIVARKMLTSPGF